ncbi:VanW family protein [Aneurinibacillus migulanus]|uniref:VanW family protein n=1 Tax=Aneurinibacillus migulanus TaxID=47500 RepID=UPI0020A19DE7|nr:VanW family protein [Aneurinibacillus migulanus]MCP1358881.1 VanW family protein [Aneurinibacillus migulanus]
MVMTWFAGLLLLFQPVAYPDSLLLVDRQGQTIATVNRADYALPLTGMSVVDVNKFQKLIDDLDRQVYRSPINAMVDDQGKIIPGQIGYKLHRQAFTEQFYTYFFSNGSSMIEVPQLEISPKVDSELLAHIREKQIGQYVTYFNASNKNRSHNIALASKAINNHVVFPDETFSFNQVVGKRTEEKGYLRAPVIVRGELSEGIGGGICQVSSTLFNAVDRAGLKIVQRYSHSRDVPYVPPGRDATVSWYGPDFRFQNKSNQPILIRAKTEGGRMIIRIYSSHVIEYKPREVPSTLERLPEEISTELMLLYKLHLIF